jgi:hypothetical protein
MLKPIKLILNLIPAFLTIILFFLYALKENKTFHLKRLLLEEFNSITEGLKNNFVLKGYFSSFS